MWTKTDTKVTVRRETRRAIFNFFDNASEMADRAIAVNAKTGFGSSRRASENLIAGDLPAAAESDAFMSKFENLTFVSTGFQTIDMPVGAVPNVGAYVAGNPMNMRCRVRTEREQAPLAIVVDLTTSAGISHRDMAKRGSVILALTRVLTAVRPVELWAFVGLSKGNHYGDGYGSTVSRGTGAVYTGCRLETSPMDLSRAAPLMANPDIARCAMYGLAMHAEHGGSGGGWAFGASLSATEFESVMRHALPHVGDVLAIPPAHMRDDLIAQPEKWLMEKIATYAPQGA